MRATIVRRKDSKRRREPDKSLEYQHESLKTSGSTMRCRWEDHHRPPASRHGNPSLSQVSWPRGSNSRLSHVLCLFTVFLVICSRSVEAAFITSWANCNTVDPRALHWSPFGVWADFGLSDNYNLNVDIYGNVTGSVTTDPLPLYNSSLWGQDNITAATNGEIIDQNPGTNLQSTLFVQFNVLGYTPYDSGPLRLCNYTTNNTKCPIAPDFNPNWTLTDLSGFTISHDLGSSYGFSTIHAYMHFVSGDNPERPLGCITADITPYLGQSTSNLLTYIPLAILVLVGIATASAAIFSPWGTWDVFRWTSNYGRDADQLRLITPGFGDCLQYLQFIVLSGSLQLDYPGFYQPAVSSISWSALMFNQSFVSSNRTADGHGDVGLVDGIYVTNGTYGLETMSQLIGMANDRNIWTGMIVWLLVIIAAVLALIQTGFAARWIYRQVSNTQEEDLRAKNFPFSAGNVIRVVFNYFMLPLVSLSMYELLITRTAVSEKSSVVPVVFAIVTIVLLILFLAWLFRLITRANPRSYLFDDLTTVLLYGPLYNTYSDNAAAFALIPVTLTFVRGIAIGAVQQIGVVQLVFLAICEVVLILTLNAFRPFSSPTSMNAYHTIFSAVRLVTVLLMVAFVSSLNVDQSVRGWIGYVILLLHGITLLVGFFLHSLQTLVEVIARVLGAGDDQGTATRGGLVKVFGVRQLSRRVPRNSARSRNSMASDAAMLAVESDAKRQSGARSRSLSASSNLLLGRGATSDRQSIALDSATGGAHSHTGSGGPPYTPTTPGGPSANAYSSLPGSSQAAGSRTSGGIVNIRAAEASDPWFRQPRQRKNTGDLQSPGSRSHGSWASGDWAKVTTPDPDSPEDALSGRVTPLPAHLGNFRERSDSNPEESGRPKTDYAIREVDFYYGVRGPALSHAPTRRFKTGPADPTGPVSSATGWFRGFFGGKTKEKGKGFEVVRSSRMPPPHSPEEEDIALEDQEPYHDDPEAQGIPATKTGKERTLELDDEGDAVGGGTRRLPSERSSPMSSDDEGRLGGNGSISDEDHGERGARQVSPLPPVLDIDTGDQFRVPSRFGSKASSRPSRSSTQKGKEPIPAVPRKSSKRTPSLGTPADFHRLSTIPASPATASKHNSLAPDWPLQSSGNTASQRLPFSGLDPNVNRNHSRNPSGGSMMSEVSAISSSSQGNSNLTHSRPSPTYREDRPSSLGYVQQHRASDGIHILGPGEEVLAGSAAELVDDNSGRTPSPEKSSQF